MDTLVRSWDLCAQDNLALSPEITRRVAMPAFVAALPQHAECGADADELIEMRYQEHRARSELQALFEDGFPAAAPDESPSAIDRTNS